MSHLDRATRTEQLVRLHTLLGIHFLFVYEAFEFSLAGEVKTMGVVLGAHTNFLPQDAEIVVGFDILRTFSFLIDGYENELFIEASGAEK